MTLILLLNPKQYGTATVEQDTSDVFRKRRREEREEEELAVKILLDRYKELQPTTEAEVPFESLLTGALQTQYYGLDAKRQKRIQQLFLLMLMDDD
jgi:hypothetical protein